MLIKAPYYRIMSQVHKKTINTEKSIYMAEKIIYDIGIIGNGPAGATAAIYAGRAGLTSIMFEKASPGGQMGITSIIENYPGFPSVEGFELAMSMNKQAKGFGASSKTSEVKSVDLLSNPKVITTSRGDFEVKSVIIAGGAKPRLLGVPGEEEYKGRGVSYCATCDGMFFRGKEVIVNGGGDTAFEDALYLSNICSKVYIVHRREGFRASASSVKKAEGHDNIEFILNAVVKEISGDESRVTSVTLKDTVTGEEKKVECSGIFVAVGRIPESDLYKDVLNLDPAGYIVAGEDCRTNVDGVFAAGDIRTKKLRQIVTACADGANAAEEAGKWLEK